MNKRLEPVAVDLLESLGIADPAALEDFDILTRMASLVTGAPKAFVSFADASDFWPVSASAPRGERLSRELAFCSALLASDEDTLVAENVRCDPRTRAIAACQPGSSVVAYAGVLLKTEDGHKLGTLCVTDQVERSLTADQIGLLRGLARQAMNLVSLRAAKRELTEALDQMTRLARTDGLTGLLNRRAFYEEAEGLRHLVRRQRGALSLVILDIDHFKRINDGLGHAAGDAVLGEIGRMLQSECAPPTGWAAWVEKSSPSPCPSPRRRPQPSASSACVSALPSDRSAMARTG